MKVNMSDVATYHPEQLPSIYDELIKERMAMDLQFSDFLRENEWKMGEDVNTPIWDAYRAMNKLYTELKNTITQCEYYMRKYNQ